MMAVGIFPVAMCPQLLRILLAWVRPYKWCISDFVIDCRTAETAENCRKLQTTKV